MKTSLHTILIFVFIPFVPVVYNLKQHLSFFLLLFLQCHHYNVIRMILIEYLNSVDKNLANLSHNELTKIPLYESTQHNFAVNCYLLNSSINYIKTQSVSPDLYIIEVV